MSVSINNKKLLNSNEFGKLIILKNNLGYDVKVFEKDDYFLSDNETLPLFNNFTESLKGLTDDEKILEIIKYYLRNHSICETRDSESIPYYDGKYTLVKSKSIDSSQRFNNSFMTINVPSSLCGVSISDLIYDKYKLDRDEFINSNLKIKKYCFNSTCFSSLYDIYFNDYFEPYINIDYPVTNGNDLSYIKDKIIELLNMEGTKADALATYTCIPPEYDLQIGLVINCGELVININSDKKIICNYFKDVVDDYNKKLENNKTLQLKLEGF